MTCADVENLFVTLQLRLDAIERRLLALEQKSSDALPYLGPWRTPARMSDYCSVCGVDTATAMHYSCNRSDCPSRIACVSKCRSTQDGEA